MRKTILSLSILLTASALLFNSYSPVSANWLVNNQGQLFYIEDGTVLGKSDKATKSNQPSQSDNRPSSNSEKPSNPQIKQVTPRSNTILLENRGNKINPKFVTQEGEVIDETGENIEIEKIEIEEPEDQNTITIRSRENASLVIRNKIAAQTHFPIMVNLDTNELIINTPKGQKIVTVLPDQAVQNMLAANVLDQLGGKGGIRWLEYQDSIATPSATPIATPSATPISTPSATPIATPSASPAASPTPTPEELPITLTTTEDGALVYEIEGSKFEKLLGLFKVKLNRTVIVSAETGELLNIKQDLPTRLLDILSV